MNDTISIQLNGNCRNVPNDMSVAQLLQHLGLPAKQVAVELNLELVPREVHNETNIKQNDQIEVVTLVGGG